MANVTAKQILQDGPRNAIVKLTGTLDTSNVTLTPAISLSDFSANEGTGNTILSGFRVDLVEWSISSGLEILLEWNSTTPKQIVPIAGRGRLDANPYGGMLPNSALAGYDGNINLKTTGFGSATATEGAAQNYSVLIELIKIYS